MSRGDYKEFELELKFTTLLEAKIHTSGQCFCPDFRLSCTFHRFVKYDTLNGCSCLLWRKQWPCTSPLRGDLRYLWGLNNQCSELRQFTNKQGIREKPQLFYSSLIVCVHQWFDIFFCYFRLSCNDLKVHGLRAGNTYDDGFQMIRINGHYLPVYCDMTTSEGAFTLIVTSAHNNWTRAEVPLR